MLFFFPLDVLDEIWGVIESVSEGYLTHYWIDVDSVDVVCPLITFIIFTVYYIACTL